MLTTTAFAQDLSPLKDRNVWLPMTGVTEQQVQDARDAGYDTVMLKIHPRLIGEGTGIDFSIHEETIRWVKVRDMKLVLAILGWVGLGNGEFWDVKESGEKVMNRLDPFWPEAMERVEWYYERVIDHYKEDPAVAAFIPTWGIYGEAGFTSGDAGRSPHALARFNEWREERGLAPLDSLPTYRDGPNTDYNRFIRFRYLYLEEKFDAMMRRLKERVPATPVGMWQEMYPVVGYLWTMVEVPSADLALYESAFPFQTVHHPEKSLGETMGFRYRCSSADDYRDYYLPLLVRKRGEGQRFMGCQLTNDYAKNYGWTEEEAEAKGFDHWEDAFGPVLKQLLDEPLEAPERDVLLVFPTYAAAALTPNVANSADTMLLDVTLRQLGCQMARYGSPRLDKMTVDDMNRFRLIIVPNAAYLVPSTYEKLKKTTATVLFTGCFGQAYGAEQVRFGATREIDGLPLRYLRRPAGPVTTATPTSGSSSSLRRRFRGYLDQHPVTLPEDETFTWEIPAAGPDVLLRCGEYPLFSTRDGGRMIFLHGQIIAGLSHDPDRKPPQLSGSQDVSANEHDMWGPYSSTNPQNQFGVLLVKSILDHAGVAYRVPVPLPRRLVPYLGDNMEACSISANIVYNNTGEPQMITVRTPWAPEGYESTRVGERYETEVTVPGFSYVALRAEGESSRGGFTR